MTIRHLKELIKDLPDDMRVYADNGGHGIMTGSEFLCGFGVSNNKAKDDVIYEHRFVLQTREDFDVAEELEAWCEYAAENNIDEQDFWTEFAERGFVPADFNDLERENWAADNLRNYGLGL